MGQYRLIAELPASGGLYRTSNVTYRGIQIGRVTKVDGDQVELEVWGEDSTGNRTTVGTATVDMKG